MTAKAANDWPYLRRKALEEAEALGTWSNSGRLPTSIRRIAEKQLVKDIQFKPLIVEGAISVEPDGFLISIRSDKEEIGDLEKRLRSDPTGRRLSHRVRFTLAHEIAHTFSLISKPNLPRTKSIWRPENITHTRDGMSSHCGALLLPRRISRRNLQPRASIDPTLCLRLLGKRTFQNRHWFHGFRVLMHRRFLARSSRVFAGKKMH